MAEVKERKQREKEMKEKEELEAERRFQKQLKEGSPLKTGKRRN